MIKEEEKYEKIIIYIYHSFDNNVPGIINVYYW